MAGWIIDRQGRFTYSDNEGDGATWEQVKHLFPNGVRKVDWPHFAAEHELTYERSMVSSLDVTRGPWETGTCRYCRQVVTRYMMEPEVCPVGPEWMRSSDDYTGPTFREMED